MSDLQTREQMLGQLDIVNRLHRLRGNSLHPAFTIYSEAADEITRLRQLLSEAEKSKKEARAKALEEAALRVDAKADSYQAEARDVRGSERDRRFYASVANRLRGAASDIRALQSEDR